MICSKIYIYIFLNFLYITANSWTKECGNYGGTDYFENCGGCGICYCLIDGIGYKGYKCVYDIIREFKLSQYFLSESRDKCEVANVCNNEEAKSDCKTVSCIPFFAAYKCKCDSTKFGRLCQYDFRPGVSHQDYAVVENVLYTPSFSFESYFTISVLFSSLGKNVEVHVETVFDEHKYDLLAVKEIDFDETYCKSLYPNHHNICSSKLFSFKNVKWVLNIRILFPGRDYHGDEYRPYMFSGNTTRRIQEKDFIGFVEKLKVSVYNNKDQNPVYNYNFKVANFFLSPRFSSCEPLVAIRQGSDTIVHIVKIAKRSEVSVANFYKVPIETTPSGKTYICIDTITDFLINWRVWKIGFNLDELTAEPLDEKVNVPHIIFKPYSLEKGQYKIRNNITLWKGVLEGFSFAFSFIEIVELDLEVLIKGGHVKSVFHKTENLLLNASLSKNPNLNHLEENDDLSYDWKCDKFPKKSSEGKIVFYPGPFEINETYTFTLTITSQVNKLYKTSFQKILSVPDPIPILDIICRKNCGFTGFQSNSAEIIYLEVLLSLSNNISQEYNVKTNNQFSWTYSSEGDKNFESVEKIRQTNTPSNVMIVLANTLRAGASYTFRVEGGADPPGRSEYNINIANPPNLDNFTCSITPPNDELWEGYFKYKIECSRLIIDKLSPIYEFYDRYANETELGRLMTSGTANTAKYVGICRGKIAIDVIDRWGMITTKEITRVIDPSPGPSRVKWLTNFIRFFHTTIDPEYKANTFSLIADMITTKKNQFNNGEEIIKDLLFRASEQDIYSYTSMKLWASSINIVAQTGVELGLDDEDAVHLSKIVLKLSGKFLETYQNSYDVLHEFTPREVLQVSKTILYSCNAIYLTRNPDLENRFVSKEDLFKEFSNYRDSVVNMMTSISEILRVLSLRTLPHLSPLSVSSMNITLWTKEDTPMSFVQLKNNTQQDSIPSVEITRNLAMFLEELSQVITITVTVYNGNPFWWDTDLRIVTNVVDIKIIKENIDKQYIDHLYEPIRVYLDFLKSSETIIEGSVQQPDPSDLTIEADEQIAVYKIRVEDQSGLRVTFHNLEEGETLRVRVLRNLRPDYNFMLSGHIITKSNPEYHKLLKEPTSKDIYDLDFLGILPGPEVPIGKWQNFNFSISVMHCASWIDPLGWSSNACDATEIRSDSQQLVCECKHLSSFAGFFTDIKNTMNPFQEYELCLTIHNNPAIPAFIIFLLLLFISTLIFFFSRAKRAKFKQCVIYMEDNFPHDKFPYLIVVYTGSRFLTGTTSNVGIVVEGEDAASRPHILRSSGYKTLQRGDDNWFIMYTPYYLGKISLIQIWSDYSGRRPEWYLYKIIVIDITEKVQYQFVINEWLSLKFGDCIERFERFESMDGNKDLKRKDFIDEHLYFGFREGHLWFGTLATYSRSALDRAQRLVVVFCGVFVAMSVSSLFYGTLDDSKEEESQLTLTDDQVAIGVIGLFVMVIITSIVVIVFRKSLKVKHGKKKSDSITSLQSFENFPYTSSHILYHKIHRSNIISRLCYVIQKYIIGRKRFVPVHCGIDIVKSEKYIKTYRNFNYTYIAWYISISIIIISAFYVIFCTLKFGRVKNFKWLRSIIFAITIDIFLLSPLKVMLISIMSVIMLAQIYDVDKYDINWHKIKVYKHQLLTADPELEVKLVSLRCKKKYIPLSYQQLVTKLNKQDRFDAGWQLLDFVLIALFLIMLILQSNTLWTTKFYWNNYELMCLLNRGIKSEGFKKSQINNVTSYLPVLKRDLFPLIYQKHWYNGQSLKESEERPSLSYTFDGVGMLFGVPRIRQLRLKPNLCEKPIFNGLSNVCPNKLTYETEDNDIYGEGWKSGGQLDSFRKSSVWDYQNSSETYDTVVFGYSSLEYGAGGYVADLSDTQAKSDDIAHYLQIERWFDSRTAAIMLELTIYNPNAGTLSWLIVITERLHIDLLINKIYIYTVDDKYDVLWLDLGVFFSMCAFIVRLILVFNRRGLKHVLFDFWNRFEIFIILLIIYCTVLYILNIKHMRRYFKDYEKSVHYVYFKFLHLIDILADMETVFTLMFIMVMCRFMKSWKFGKVFDRLFHTLWSVWVSIIWVFFLICLQIYFYSEKISYLLNEFIHSQTFFLLICKFDFRYTVKDCKVPSCKVGLFMWSMTTNFFFLLITIHYLWSYSAIKNRTIDKEVDNLCTLLLFGKRGKGRKSYIVHRH